jgi:glucosyl-3-phosphoglycerate phosphatase
MHLYLVRHGETQWNNQRRLQGQTDEPLSETGREQARALAPLIALNPPAHVICSDLSRASETADLLGYTSAMRDPRLREMDLGTWSGRLIAEIVADNEAAYLGWRAGTYTPPGAETWEVFRSRVVSVINDLSDARADVLLVAHGGVIRALCDALLGLKPSHVVPVGPATLTTIALTQRDKTWHGKLEAFNVRAAAPIYNAPD